jgi:hypothetical protein
VTRSRDERRQPDMCPGCGYYKFIYGGVCRDDCTCLDCVYRRLQLPLFDLSELT